MKPSLIHPSYFGPVDLYAEIAQADKFVFETKDNYQKQTYRSRQYIYGANGRLLLNIPVKHRKNKTDKHQKYRDIKIENEFKWQKLHWKSLEAAYRTSPFFEYYEDEFLPLFEKRATFLMDFNLMCMQIVFDCLQINFEYDETKKFEFIHEEYKDCRSLVNAKRTPEFKLEKYIQVFEAKFGYLHNLSILDLLFNEGPAALSYLQNQKRKG
ncbi:WbqC family protein [Psychroflexus aestuariivivens]|uniref:WbqC family protein n=1 Tax=Psychroflexus aestuariivivens TaxID=1795040 RepID=UPI000FD926BC|nr:WbqC family protein [Psychroflexus aestuariivivens]